MDKSPVYPPRYTLRNILQFDAADLAANRQGWLSPRQRQVYFHPINLLRRYWYQLFQIGEKYKGQVLAVHGVIQLAVEGRNCILQVGKFERFRLHPDEYMAFDNEGAVGKTYAVYYHPITYAVLSAEPIMEE